MKKPSSRRKSKEKKETELKEIIKEEFENKKEENNKDKHDFIPDIEDIEEEKQFIKENKKQDFIPQGLDNDFQEELPSLIEKRKVSLDRMNIQKQGNFNLESFIENSPINQIKKQAWQEEFNPMSYTAGIKDSDEPKYMDYNNNFNPVEKMNVNSLSAFREEKGSIQFNPMHKQENKSIEAYVPVEKVNISELGKKKSNFIDSSKEIKYTPGEY